MAEKWREARLIPTSGIRGATEQEMRATSALLSVLTIVPGFAHAVLKPCGAPLGKMRANVEAFTEVAFEDKKAKIAPRPDGLIRVTRGDKTWVALVEVKTGTNELDAGQIDAYLDIAKAQGFDAVITISNQIPAGVGALPFKADGRKLKSVPVFHFPWVRLVSLAISEKEVHGIDDPEQSWILGELIRYLQHDNSGALDFTDMGQAWMPFTEAVRSGLVKPTNPDVVDIAMKFDGLIQFLCLKLGQRLGVEVTPVFSRSEQLNPDERTKNLANEVAKSQTLSARIRVPETVADIQIVCDLRARQITTFAMIPASGQARNQTRVNWLLKPLAEDVKDVVIEAHAPRRNIAASLKDFRGDLRDVVPNDFPDITKFTISQHHPMGMQKTTAARSSFINSVAEAIDRFYVEILQRQRSWSAPAPVYKERRLEPAEDEVLTTQEIVKNEDREDDEQS